MMKPGSLHHLWALLYKRKTNHQTTMDFLVQMLVLAFSITIVQAGVTNAKYKSRYDDIAETLVSQIQDPSKKDILYELLNRMQSQGDSRLPKPRIDGLKQDVIQGGSVMRSLENENIRNTEDTDILKDKTSAMFEKDFDDKRYLSTLTGYPSEEGENDELNVDGRNVVQLASMVKMTTGKPSWKYLNYGCHCGLGGRGRVVDNLDRCCQVHDECYRKLKADSGCKLLLFKTYKWKDDKGNITCQPDSDQCKEQLCICDKVVAECLADHQSEYNNRYTGWWWLIKKSWDC